MKKFIRSIAAYFLGNVLSKLIVFLLLPLYTAYIRPDDYGYYDLTVTYVSLFSSILFLDIWSGILRFMFDSDQREEKLKTIYSSLLVYGASLALYIVLFSVLNAVMPFRYFPLILLYGACLTLQNFYGSITRGFGKSVLFALSGILSTALTVALNILFIVVFQQSYWSLYVASSAGILAQVLLLEFCLKLIPNFSVKRIDRAFAKQIFRYSLPLCLNSAAYWFLTGFNRIVIVDSLGESQNGYFAIAGKFSAIISLVGSCFTLAWQETAYRKEGEHSGSGAYYSRAGDQYLRFLWMGTVCLLPFIGILFPYLVDSAYAPAKMLVPLNLLGTASSLYSAFLGDIFGAIKQNRIIFLSTLTAAGVNVLVLYLLIGPLGVQAANIAFLAGFSVNCAIRAALLHKILHFRVSLKPFLLYGALFAVSSYVFQTRGLLESVVLLAAAAGIALRLFRGTLISVWKGIRLKNSDLT